MMVVGKRGKQNGKQNEKKSTRSRGQKKEKPKQLSLSFDLLSFPDSD